MSLVQTMNKEDLNLTDESVSGESGYNDSSMVPMESLCFDSLDSSHQNWPIAPDGYLPNSIIRSWMPGQKLSKPQEPKNILALGRTFLPKDEEPRTDITVVMPTAKSVQLRNFSPLVCPQEEVLQVDDSRELLKSIAESSWLIERPDVDLVMVINALLCTMDGMDHVVYDKCTEALLRIHKVFFIPPKSIEKLSMTLLKHMESGNPLWKRMEALKILANLELLQDMDLFKLAEVLLDEVVDLRNMARDLLFQFFHIDTKTALFPRLQLEAGHELLNQLKTRLTEELNLKPVTVQKPEKLSIVQTEPKKVSLVQLIPPLVSSSDSLKQDSKLEVPDLPLTCPWPTQKPQPVPQPSMPCRPSQSRDNLPPQPPPRKHKKFTPSTVRKSAVTKIQEVHDHLRLMEVYRTAKIHRGVEKLRPCKPPSAGPASISVNSRLEPIKCRRDPDWRKSLNELVSLYGFRSLCASRMFPLGPLAVPLGPLTVPLGPLAVPLGPLAVPLGPLAVPLGPLAVPDVSQYLPCSLSPLQSWSAVQVSLGQRVMRRIQVSAPSRLKPPSMFHHRVPLPWQLNSHTLDPSGQSQYGRLEVNWVSEPLKMLPRSQEEKLKLASINS